MRGHEADYLGIWEEFGPVSPNPDYSSPSVEEVRSWQSKLGELMLGHAQFLATHIYLLPEEHQDKAVEKMLSHHNPHEIPSALAAQPFLVDQQLMAVVLGLESHLQGLGLTHHLTIVPLGSAVHGGLRLRSFFGNQSVYKAEDVDLGAIVDTQDLKGNDLSQVLQALQAETERYMGQVAQARLCPFINLETMGVPRLKSAKNAYEQIEAWERAVLDRKNLGNLHEVHWQDKDPFFLYFEPSLDRERNEELMIKAMRQISLEDYDRWKRLALGMLEVWYDIHRIKDKHLGNALRHEYGYHELDSLARYVEIHSSRIMAHHMRSLLEGTNATGKRFRWSLWG